MSKWILLQTSIATVFCCGERADNASSQAIRTGSPLITLQDAYDVQHEQLDGQEQLVYLVKATYPAEGSLDSILESLEQKGWTPIEEDVFNPGTPSSHLEGWRTFVDSTGSTERTIHQWMGEWADEKGRILLYAFRFSCPVHDQFHTNVMEVRIALMKSDPREGR